LVAINVPNGSRQFRHRGFAIDPAKTKAPLVVDADAILPVAIPAELLKSIAGRYAQVVERISGVKQRELTQCRPLQTSSEFFNALVPKEAFGFLVGKSANHNAIITPRANNVKR
jgi:hypothetical protein